MTSLFHRQPSFLNALAHLPCSVEGAGCPYIRDVQALIWCACSAGLQRLQRLDIGWCSGVTDGDVAALARLPALTYLQLARAQAGPNPALTLSTRVPGHMHLGELVRQSTCIWARSLCASEPRCGYVSMESASSGVVVF